MFLAAAAAAALVYPVVGAGPGRSRPRRPQHLDRRHRPFVRRIQRQAHDGLDRPRHARAGRAARSSTTASRSTSLKADITIDVTGINTGNENRDKDLKSPNFFDVAKYPTITFKSKRVGGGRRGQDSSLIGDLTMHGVTKEVALDVEGPLAGYPGAVAARRVGASATTKLNRSDFGLQVQPADRGGARSSATKSSVHDRHRSQQKVEFRPEKPPCDRCWPLSCSPSCLAPQTAPAPVPVVVELFTSEGCSSCPPADQLLSVLVTKQPVAASPSSASSCTSTTGIRSAGRIPRRSAAPLPGSSRTSRIFGADRMYTPQMVVDGRDELVGSDQSGVARRAIDRALHRPHAKVEASGSVDGTTTGGTVVVTDIPADAAKEQLEATLALTENDVTTAVKRGENGGRTLHHDALVRQIVPLGRVVSGEALRWHVPIDATWRRDHLNAVVVVQSRKSLRIWGAGIAPLH